MEQSRFFTLVWRFNALLITAIGLVGICILVYATYQIAKDTFGEKRVRNIVNIENDRGVTETLSLRHMSQIGDGPFVMISLVSSQKYPQDHFSKSTSSTRNWLFVDTKGANRHWLLESHKDLIISTQTLSLDRSRQSEDNSVKAILYTVISSDTNGDGRLTGEDAKSIALSRGSGKDYRVVVEGADDIIGHQMVDEGTVFVAYQKRQNAYFKTINLSDFSSSAEVDLPKHGHTN